LAGYGKCFIWREAFHLAWLVREQGEMMASGMNWVMEAEKDRITDEDRKRIDEKLRSIGIDREIYMPYLLNQIVDLDADHVQSMTADDETPTRRKRRKA